MMAAQPIEIVQAETDDHVKAVRALFLEYAQTLGFDLCFQGFEEELKQLPGKYSRPGGRLLLARYDGVDAGCVAVQSLGSDLCEMKRLFVRPAFRGRQFGRALAEGAIRESRNAGYRGMRLDTIEPLMTAAVALYRSLGFREIEPYRPNPIPGALYMERAL